MDSSPPFNLLPPPPPPPPPPHPNPNYIFTPYNNNHRHHNPSAAPTSIPAQPSNLNATLSTLKQLINLSKTTINSLSNILPVTAAATPTATCPYNFNHRVPSTSLFHHYLQCPSSPAPIDLALLHSIHYRNSIQSSHSLLSQKTNCFTQKLSNDANTDLCISLDDYHTSIDSNFFYRDCPAVVTFPHEDNNSNRMLSLPAVLSAECTNLTGDGGDIRDTIDGLLSSSYSIKLLPSEYCNVRAEITQWNEYPSFYSHGVVRSVVCSYISQKEDLKEWIVVNSPFYGVVIDEFLRDHILLLFRLCLKAIVREAIGYLVPISRGEPTNGKRFFECPVLVRVLMWLSSQLAILYGEVNGKLFAANMFKQSLLIASSKTLFHFGEQRVGESSGLSKVDGETTPLKGGKENDGSTMEIVFVSQVAAAVAALHERSAFERRIKAIHSLQSLPVYQRVQEHGYISQKAEEERGKRSNYRPIIEHDGVLWQRGGNQDGNKNKSREELLAEERDYKRRRMSYRGKKMKRSTTQVMRDIIDEYMEEIKHANLDGQPLVDATNRASEPPSVSDTHANTEARIVVLSSKTNKMVPQNHRKESASERYEDEINKQVNEHRRDGQKQEYDAIGESRYRREYLSKTADGRRSTSHSHDHEKRDEEKHSRKYHPSSPNRSHKRHHVPEYVDSNDSHRRSKNKNKRTSSIVCDEFEDRYDPSGSHDIEEDM